MNNLAEFIEEGHLPRATANSADLGIDEQLEVARDVFVALLAKRDEYKHQAPDRYSICTELKRLAPIDVGQHPDVYFALMQSMLQIEGILAQDYALILLNAIDEQMLTKAQAAKLAFYHVANKTDDNYEFSANDVMELLSMHNSQTYDNHRYLFKIICNGCEFIDLPAKKDFLHAIFQQTHNYMQIADNYDELLALYHEGLSTPDLLIEWLRNKHNFATLTPEQVESVLDIIQHYASSHRKTKLIELSSVLEPTRLLELFRATTATLDLATAILNAGIPKQEALSLIEAIMTKSHAVISSESVVAEIGLWKLGLTKDEILHFAMHYPLRADELDVWVSKQNLTNQEREELLDQRIAISRFVCSDALIQYYSINNAQMALFINKCMEQSVALGIHTVNQLSWQEYYTLQRKYHKHDLINVIIDHLFSAPHHDTDPFVKDYLGIEHYTGSTIEDLSISNRLFSVHFATPNIYPILSTITHRFIRPDIAEGNEMAFMLMGSWLRTITIRLSQEIDKCKIKALFNFSTADIKKFTDNKAAREALFADQLAEKTADKPTISASTSQIQDNPYIAAARVHVVIAMEEIMGLAIPNVRITLMDNILNLINDDQKLQLFNAILSNNISKRLYIPTLIAVSSLNRSDLMQIFSSPRQHIEQLFKVIMLIDNNYDDTQNLHSLINAWLPLFSSTKISYIDKCRVAHKALAYDVKIELFANQEQMLQEYAKRRDTIEFTQMYISIYEDKIGLQAFPLHGELLELLDIAALPRLHDLNKFLKNLIGKRTAAKIGPKQIPEITSKIIKTKMFPCGLNAQKQAWGMILGLSKLNELGILQHKQFERTSWLHNLGYAIQKCFTLADNDVDGVVAYLQQSRNPIAIITYYTLLNSIPENKPYVQLVKEFVHLIASQGFAQYYQYRRSYTAQPQLKTAIGNNIALLNEWSNGLAVNFNLFMSRFMDYLDIYAKSEQFDAKAYICGQILHHLPKKFEYVHQYLANPQNAASILTNARNSIQSEITPKDKYGHRHKFFTAQIHLIEFLNNQACSREQKKKKLDIVRQDFYCCNDIALDDFIKDLTFTTDILNADDRKNLATKKNVSTENWTIADTGEPEDMFLIGTEVENSCQHIDRSYTNKCLIGGYVLSGHIRQIAIKDENNKLVARAVFRLMMDFVTKRPVLFLERFYPENCTKEQARAMELFACLRALQLNCALVRSRSPLVIPEYPGMLNVVAVKNMEYVDALHSAQTDDYTIINARYLFDPTRYREAVQQIANNKKGVLTCENSPLYKIALQQNGALSGPQSGPRPLNSVDDLKFMFNNYRQKTGGSAADFWQQIIGYRSTPKA